MEKNFRPWTYLFLVSLLTAQLWGAQGLDPSPPSRVSDAVVQLLAIGPGTVDTNRECSGTGFLINEEGYILTNAHVFEEAQRCLGKGTNAKMVAKLPRPGKATAAAVSCDRVCSDDLRDLALLRAERPLPEKHAYLLLDASEVPEGTLVTFTGHPLFVWGAVSQTGRVVSRQRLALSDDPGMPSEVLILSAAARPGNSGSPVCRTEDGSVIAIVERKAPRDTTETVAVSIRHAIELLNRCGVKWHAAGTNYKF